MRRALPALCLAIVALLVTVLAACNRDGVIASVPDGATADDLAVAVAPPPADLAGEVDGSPGAPRRSAPAGATPAPCASTG